jgi:hypothetical protein
MSEPHTHGGTDAPECTTCASQRFPILFQGNRGDPKTLLEVIGQGVGAGSVCWSNLYAAGEFNSARASKIVDEMVTWIEERYVPKGMNGDDNG